MNTTDQWPDLIICTRCVTGVNDWLSRHNLIQENPFAQALLEPATNLDPKYYPLWILNESDGTRYRTVVKRVES